MSPGMPIDNQNLLHSDGGCLLLGVVRSSNTHNCLTALCPGLPRWAGTRRNIHPLTPILIIRHPISTSSIYYNPQHPPCSSCVPDSPFPQPLFRSSLVFTLVWDLRLHTPCISLPNRHLFFTTHAHTIATCFPVLFFSHPMPSVL